jgi:hypothetical protein
MSIRSKKGLMLLFLFPLLFLVTGASAEIAAITATPLAVFALGAGIFLQRLLFSHDHDPSIPKMLKGCKFPDQARPYDSSVGLSL